LATIFTGLQNKLQSTKASEKTFLQQILGRLNAWCGFKQQESYGSLSTKNVGTDTTSIAASVMCAIKRWNAERV